MRNLINFGVLKGACMASSLLSLHQDYLGKEGYIKYVSEHWVDSLITVPIAVILLIVSLVLPNRFRTKAEGLTR